MEDLAQAGAETALVGRDLAGEGHGQGRPAVEGAGKGDDGGPAGRRPRDLDGVLDRLGPRGEQDAFGRGLERGKGVEPLAEGYIGLVAGDLEGDVGIGVELRLDRRDHLGMPVAHVQHGDPGREIDVAPPLDVPQFRVLGPVQKDRGRGGDPVGHGLSPAIHEFPIAGQHSGPKPRCRQ